MSLVVRNMSDSHIFLKKGVPVARVVCITGAAHRVVTRDGSHSRCGTPTQTHVGGSQVGKVVGEIELRWAGPLVP